VIIADALFTATRFAQPLTSAALAGCRGLFVARTLDHVVVRALSVYGRLLAAGRRDPG
jgi:hypothetical protein